MKLGKSVLWLSIEDGNKSGLKNIYPVMAPPKVCRMCANPSEARGQALPWHCDASLSREEVIQVLLASYQSLRMKLSLN